MTSNNNSSITINNSNGTTTTFNFKFENGLPIKPIIYPNFEIIEYEDHSLGFHIYLEEQNMNNNYFNIEHYAVNDKEVLISLNLNHIILSNLPNEIITMAKNKKIPFCFFKLDNTFINGIKLK